jgi:FkbM family methyltransferase
VTFESAAGWLRQLPTGGARGSLRNLYRAAMSLGTFGRGLRRSLPSGEAVFVSPAHRHINWNTIEVEAFRDAIAPGAVAFDVGANVGAYALLLGHAVGAAGRVYAFEPSPVAFAGLREHIRLNRLADRVTAVHCAVGAEVATLPFIVASTAGEGRLAPDARLDGALQVPVTTIDAFCERERVTPDFIKIDVEGAELDVLRGARETIGRTRGRLALFVELHPSIWPERGLSRADVERGFDDLGLRVESLLPDVDPFTVEGVTARALTR